MSKQNEQKQNAQKSGLKKPGTTSGYATPAKAKRPFTEVADCSAEEITLLSNQMEEIGADVKLLKEGLSQMMNKNEIKDFIKLTVEGIMTEINANMELTIDIQVKEKTDKMNMELASLKEENETLKTALKSLKDSQIKTNETAKIALQKANYNEQFSRKHNFKILSITDRAIETEATLTQDVCSYFKKQNVTMTTENIVAIHRIPGKPGLPKPVLLKLKNNSEKTKLMKARRAMKTSGHRLVDDVTKLNSDLIGQLNNHQKIDSAWYFNGAVYGKTKVGDRLKFDIHDDIDKVIEKA